MTIGDAKKSVQSAWTRMLFAGADERFFQELNRRVQTLGDAICQELGVTRSEAQELPTDTPLGPKSSEVLNQFRLWLTMTHEEEELDD